MHYAPCHVPKDHFPLTDYCERLDTGRFNVAERAATLCVHVIATRCLAREKIWCACRPRPRVEHGGFQLCPILLTTSSSTSYQEPVMSSTYYVISIDAVHRYWPREPDLLCNVWRKVSSSEHQHSLDTVRTALSCKHFHQDNFFHCLETCGDANPAWICFLARRSASPQKRNPLHSRKLLVRWAEILHESILGQIKLPAESSSAVCGANTGSCCGLCANTC